MAECQETALSIEEKEENFGNNLSHQNADRRLLVQKYSSIGNKCENSQSNEDQQNEKDRKVEDSDQAVHGSEQRNFPEENKGQTVHARVEGSQASQVRMEEISCQKGGQQDPQHYAGQGLMYGNFGKQPSGGDSGGQEKIAREPENAPTSYSEAAKANIPQKQKSYIRQTISGVKVGI